jgi:hypothetical protein
MRNTDSAEARIAAPAVGAFVAAGACLLIVLAAAVVFIRPTVGAVPQDNSATVGGLHYAVNNAWPLNPRRAVDAQVARGLPAADRNLGRGEMLYAVFVGVTNETHERLPMATQVALRDVTNREYTPVRLGAHNRYAYRPRMMAAQTHRPGPWTPAGQDMSAEGLMLVFRIPRGAYENGPLELLVHDPGDPTSVASLLTL